MRKYIIEIVKEPLSRGLLILVFILTAVLIINVTGCTPKSENVVPPPVDTQKTKQDTQEIEKSYPPGTNTVEIKLNPIKEKLTAIVDTLKYGEHPNMRYNTRVRTMRNDIIDDLGFTIDESRIFDLGGDTLFYPRTKREQIISDNNSELAYD